MAKFTPENQDIPIADNTRAAGSVRADTSLAGLFEGAADLFNIAVKGKDKMYQMRATEEAERSAREIRDLTIGTTLAENAQLKQLPPEAMAGIQRLGRAREAMLSGRTTYSHYYTMLDAESRRIRSRYPGYRDFVDQAFAKITGVDPANALLRSIQSENEALANERAKKGEMSKDYGKSIDDIFRTYGQYISPETIKARENGTIPNTQEAVSKLSVEVAQRRRALADQDEDKRKLEAAREKGVLNQKEAVTKAHQAFHANYKMNLDRVILSAFPDKETFFRIASGEIDISRDPKAMEQWSNVIQKIDMLGRSVLDNTLYEETVGADNKPRSYYKAIGAENVKTYTDLAMDFHNRMMEPLKAGTKDSLSVFNRLYQKLDRLEKTGQLRAMEREPLLEMLATAKGFGDNVAGALFNDLMRNPDNRTKIHSAFILENSVEENNPQRLNPGKSFWKNYDSSTKQEPVLDKSKVLKDSLSEMNTLLSNPDVKPETKTALVRSLFNEDGLRVLGKMGVDSRLRLYSTLVSNPNMVKHITSLKESDPRSYRRAINYIGQMFYGSVKPMLDTMALGIERGSFDIEWDNNNGKFKPIKKGPKGFDASGRMISEEFNSVIDRTRVEQVNKLNDAIENLKPFLASQGKDTPEQILDYLRSVGIQQDQTQFKGSLLDQMIKSVSKYVKQKEEPAPVITDTAPVQ